MKNNPLKNIIYLGLICLLMSGVLLVDRPAGAESRLTPQQKSQITATNSRNLRMLARRYTKYTNHTPVIMGCNRSASQNKNVKAILNMVNNMQSDWNNRHLYRVLRNYDQNYKTRDGLNLAKVEENLRTFWDHNPYTLVTSIPTSIYICGDRANISLVEFTDTPLKAEDRRATDYKDNGNMIYFGSQIRGSTILKKYPQGWKITEEKINTEIIWRYTTKLAKEMLDSGQITLVVPDELVEGSDFIAKLDYNLPNNLKALAFFEQSTSQDLNHDEQAPKKPKEDPLEISRVISDTSELGLRRFFQVNAAGQAEYITANIELLHFPDLKRPKNFYPAGLISIIKRVNVAPKYEKIDKKKTITKAYRDE